MDESEQEAGQERQAFDSLPRETQRELRKLRSEAAAARKKTEQLSEELLAERYGMDIVALLPPEVKTFERRVELAEQYRSQFAPTAPAPEPDEVEPLGLAAITRAHAAPVGVINRDLLSIAEIKELAKTDPVRASQLAMQGRYEKPEALS